MHILHAQTMQFPTDTQSKGQFWLASYRSDQDRWYNMNTSNKLLYPQHNKSVIYDHHTDHLSPMFWFLFFGSVSRVFPRWPLRPQKSSAPATR